MKTIQECLKECNRTDVIGAYIYRHLQNGWIFENKDKTIEEIRLSYEKKLNELIDRLIAVTPKPGNERMIFLACHCSPDDNGSDIWFMLIKEEDIFKKGWAVPYGYEFIPFEEAVAYYVADTYLTQYELHNLLAEFLYEISFTGFNQEHLDETLADLDESIKEANEHRGSPEYFVSHEELVARLEETTGFEFEKKDPEQEEAWKDLMTQICNYNTRCQQIELKKLRKLLEEKHA